VPYLNRLERNELFRVAVGLGFSAADFETSVDETSFTAVYAPTRDWFRVHESPLLVLGRSKVGDCEDRTLPIGLKTNVGEWFDKWLREVMRFHAEPDLWERAKRDEVLVQAAADDLDNAPFDEADKVALRVELDELLRTGQDAYSLTDDQYGQLAAGIADLAARLDKMGRREWLTYAAGTLALLQATVLPPDESRSILTKLVKAAANAFGHRIGLPAGP
jgi:hypothetical protein